MVGDDSDNYSTNSAVQFSLGIKPTVGFRYYSSTKLIDNIYDQSLLRLVFRFRHLDFRY